MVTLFLLLPINPRTEDGRADSDDRCAVANRQGPVMGHADGEFRKIRQREPVVKMLFESLDANEICLDDRFVIGIGRHSHQTAETDMGIRPLDPFDKLSAPLRDRSKDFFDLRLGEAALCLLRTEMQFKQHIDDLTVLTSPLLYGIQQMSRIDGLDQRSIGQYHFEFIGLKMADEMPFYILGKLDGLGCELLGAVLSEPPLPGPVCLEDILAWVEFGNCHQFDFWRQFLIDPSEIIIYHSSWPVPSASGPASSGPLPDAAATCSSVASSPR